MEEIDIKELISMFLEKKFLIIVVVLIAAILGAVYTLKIIVPEYQSSTSLVLVQITNDKSLDDTNSISTNDLTLNAKLVDNYREIAKSKTVTTKVIENLGLNMSLADLQKSIDVTSITDTELIKITATNTDPELACKIANEVAKIFIEKTDEIYKINNVHVLDAAEVDYEPSNIHLAKNVVIAAFIGFILVSAYILLANMLDTTVKTDTDIERVLKVPVLASIVLTDELTKKKKKSIGISQEDVQISYKEEKNNNSNNKKGKKGGNK